MPTQLHFMHLGLATIGGSGSWFSFQQRLIAWAAFLALSSLILQRQGHRPPGKARLALALPLASLNLLTPLLFDREAELVTNIIASFATVWLTSFKALGWALNRGPLALPLTPLQFMAVYAFPIAPATVDAPADPADVDDAQGKRKAGGGAPQLDLSPGDAMENLRNFLAKCAGLACVVWALRRLQPEPGLLHTFLCGLGLYCLLGSLEDGPAVLAASAIGFKAATHFDRPYVSTSVASFWNQRWNLAAGGTVRFLVFDPIVQGRAVFDAAAPRVPHPSPARRALAVCATFAVSGLMHELVFWYIARRLSGYWLAFCAAQAPLVLGEAAARAALRRRGLEVPTWMAVPLTLLTVTLVGNALFMPDVTRAGIAGAVISHIWQSVSALPRVALAAAGLLERGWVMVDVAAPAVRVSAV